MRRQLALKDPHLEGDDIKEVQRKLGFRGAALTATSARTPPSASRSGSGRSASRQPDQQHARAALPRALSSGRSPSRRTSSVAPRSGRDKPFSPPRTGSCCRSRRPCRASRSSRSWSRRGRRTKPASAIMPASTGSLRRHGRARPRRRKDHRGQAVRGHDWSSLRRDGEDRGRRSQGLDLQARRPERGRGRQRLRRQAGRGGQPLGRRARARPHRDPQDERGRACVREHARPAAVLSRSAPLARAALNRLLSARGADEVPAR